MWVSCESISHQSPPLHTPSRSLTRVAGNLPPPACCIPAYLHKLHNYMQTPRPRAFNKK
ncbi:hypothetical protein BU24DRAFT_416573 [Aaosphaeria arxii CBS 175.79]|uniref:Uncharacterized protein n=1 Tax=Aaosphaeria arxii CBS 175.79 TaxID=1450172 RepID=A0A6A5Y5X8_9PLEO|nr:uncharacterized protein BU24DRAFT_416573 [Aaosphaeria arxii CBS 175.79]KAF2020908.1 hypothetical protein BU24DRAFT_416573 [Aaosphaeria arxii CBS 175.79]